MKSFCQLHDLDIQKFYYYRRRFSGVIKTKKAATSPSCDFHSINLGKPSKNQTQSKKYMWLYKTGETKRPIILYDYQKTRSSSCPRDFLTGFKGYLQTDGYAVCNKVPDVIRAACLAHIRRKFYDIIRELDEESLKQSRVVIKR